MHIYVLRCPKCQHIIVLEELQDEDILDMEESDYEQEELTDTEVLSDTEEGDAPNIAQDKTKSL